MGPWERDMWKGDKHREQSEQCHRLLSSLDMRHAAFVDASLAGTLGFIWRACSRSSVRASILDSFFIGLLVPVSVSLLLALALYSKPLLSSQIATQIWSHIRIAASWQACSITAYGLWTCRAESHMNGLLETKCAQLFLIKD